MLKALRKRDGRSAGEYLLPRTYESPDFDDRFFAEINKLIKEIDERNPGIATKEEINNLFLFACKNNNVNLLHFFFIRNAIKDPENILDEEGRNGLHLASMNGQAEACLYLIENYNFDVNKKSPDKLLPLHYCIRSFNGNDREFSLNLRDGYYLPKRLNTFEVLLEKKADYRESSNLRTNSIAEILAIEYDDKKKFYTQIDDQIVKPLIRSILVSGARVGIFCNPFKDGPIDSAGGAGRISIMSYVRESQRKIAGGEAEETNKKKWKVEKVRKSMTDAIQKEPGNNLHGAHIAASRFSMETPERK